MVDVATNPILYLVFGNAISTMVNKCSIYTAAFFTIMNFRWLQVLHATSSTIKYLQVPFGNSITHGKIISKFIIAQQLSWKGLLSV